MKQVDAQFMLVCAVSPEDQKLFIEWMREQRHRTNFDTDVIGYPRSCMTIARTDGETAMMIPLHPILMFESMAKRPGLDDKYAALCMSKIGEQVEETMKLTGHGEAYFITNDENEVKATEARGWKAIMHDAERGLWLMKKKANVDWAKLADLRAAEEVVKKAGPIPCA